MEFYKWGLEVPSKFSFSVSISGGLELFVFINNYFIIHFLGFDHHKELFHRSRDSSDLVQCYTTYITKQLSKFSEEFEATHIGAVIIEPGKKGQ